MRKCYILLDGAISHLRNFNLAKIGDAVYPTVGYDYGLSRDDTYAFGEQFIMVTTDPDGDPDWKRGGFTVPVRCLQEQTPVSEDAYEQPCEVVV